MDSIQVQFTESTGFKKDLKKLCRKYKTLPEDIENLKKALQIAHFTADITPESMGFFPVSHRDIPEGFFIAKKFACRSIKGSGSRSGFRVVYHLEGSCFRICLIEIFHKNQKEIEDFSRIQDYLSKEGQ